MPRILSTVVLAVVIAPALAAQQADTTTAPRKHVPLGAVTVTATRSERATFDTPQPITVLDSLDLRAKAPNGVADLFRDIAGLDASGVGPNQRRPEIRGQRGQRILLLQDGLRLNNARRQQDFGEIPAVAGLSSVSRVEVVRGPSSVLYGTDAIGGVVNLITSGVPRTASGDVHGALEYRYGSAGDALFPSGALSMRVGKLGISAGGAYREAADYTAPKGSFGSITLDDDVRVNDSGIRDRSGRIAFGYDVRRSGELFGRAEFYSADKAGFGWIDPSYLGSNQPKIQITYPDQRFARYTLGYRDNALGTFFANRAEITAYVQDNERRLRNDIYVPFSPTAGMTSNSLNYTDLATVGGRLELAKVVGSLGVLTYGFDAFRDKSLGTDTSTTVITGFGPPTTRTSNVPSIPSATFRSAGVFTQLEMNPVTRFTTIVGIRAQDIAADTRPTPNVTRPLQTGSDRTVVWTANGLYRLTGDLNLVSSVGRGFRAPNLVERFFDGAATETNAYLKSNPDLAAETSINTDLGLRWRHGALYAESFVFRNDVSNAVKGVATGEIVNGRPAYQNRNVGKLRLEGLELIAGARTQRGVEGSVSWTRIDGRNVSDPNTPVGDSYSSKVVGDLGYQAPSGRFSLGYTTRFQGEQKDVIVGTNPLGTVIPSFVVHSARATVRLLDRAGLTHHLTITAENLGNRLYAEFPNASFFRPEPGRSVRLALVTGF